MNIKSDKLKKQNILVVHNRYKIRGGEDTVFENEVELLKQNGHNVFTYERDNKEIDGFSLFQKLCLPFNMIFNFRSYNEIRKIIREQNIEIVHVHNTLNIISPAVFYAACKEKVAVVNTIHNFRLICPGAMLFRDGHICEECISDSANIGRACKYGCYRGSKLQTFIYVLSQKIHRMSGIYSKVRFICLTEFNKEKLLRINKNRRYIKPENIYIRGNFCASPYKEKSQIIPFSERKKENYILFAGRLDKMKGFDRLLKLYEDNKECGLPKLIVCGPGEYTDFPENVEYKGILDKKELLDIMSKAKALILPTKWYEGFPMSIAESYSVGTPVLTSNFGNAGALAVGLTFNPDDISEMKEAILACDTLPDDICEKVYELYLSKYSENEAYSSLINIYDSLN